MIPVVAAVSVMLAVMFGPPTDKGAVSVPQTNTQSTPYKAPAGTRKFVTKDLTIHDAARGKDLEIRVRIPSSEGAKGAAASKAAAAEPTGAGADAKLPLVVFSHGAGGSRTAFGNLLDDLASHGYASIAITHSDSIELKKRAGEKPAEYLTSQGRTKLRQSVKLGERVGDCSFVVDQLDEISSRFVEAGGSAFTIDPERIAVAGHSAGAYTTQLCVGVQARGAGIGAGGLGLKSIADDRSRRGSSSRGRAPSLDC